MAIHHTDVEKLIRLGAIVGIDAKSVHHTDAEQLIKLTTKGRQLTIHNADTYHWTDLERLVQMAGDRAVFEMSFK
jgi:hypothetical protein